MAKWVRFVAIPVVVLVLLPLLMSVVGDLGFWKRYVKAVVRGEPDVAASEYQAVLRLAEQQRHEPAPIADAPSQQMVPEALVAAQQFAIDAKSRALIVHRRGHRLLHWFASDADATRPLAGAELSLLPVALALQTPLGTASSAARPEEQRAVIEAWLKQVALDTHRASAESASWRRPWSAPARAWFDPEAIKLPAGITSEELRKALEVQLWKPMGLGEAQVWKDSSGLPLWHCCIAASAADWMKFADLILQRGQIQGVQVVQTDDLLHLLPLDPQGRTQPLWRGQTSLLTGDEPPAARDAFWFDLGEGARLWLSPARELAVLHWAGSATDRADITLTNLLFRAINDPPGAQAGPVIESVVPQH